MPSRLLLNVMNLRRNLNTWSRSTMHSSKEWALANKTSTTLKKKSCLKTQQCQIEIIRINIHMMLLEARTSATAVLADLMLTTHPALASTKTTTTAKSMAMKMIFRMVMTRSKRQTSKPFETIEETHKLRASLSGEEAARTIHCVRIQCQTSLTSTWTIWWIAMRSTATINLMNLNKMSKSKKKKSCMLVSKDMCKKQMLQDPQESLKEESAIRIKSSQMVQVKL